MSNIEKIKAEIERRAKFHDDAMKACVGLNNIALTHSAGWKEDTELLAFIDSLPEEKPSEDLEEEIQGMNQAIFGTDIINRREMVYLETFDMIARHFAEWGREQMI